MNLLKKSQKRNLDMEDIMQSIKEPCSVPGGGKRRKSLWALSLPVLKKLAAKFTRNMVSAAVLSQAGKSHQRLRRNIINLCWKFLKSKDVARCRLLSPGRLIEVKKSVRP